jgi:hypothetical protein
LAVEVVLVERRSAVVRALRLVSFSPDFSRALATAVSAALARWEGHEDYDRRLALVCSRYPTTEGLLSLVTHRTAGGA